MSRRRGLHAAPRRRWNRLALAALVLVAVVVAAIVVRCAGTDPTPQRRATRPGATVMPGDSAVPDVPVPVNAEFAWPTDLSWETVAGVDLPVSVQDGPRNQAAGLAKDFSQSPAGAVLAAMHLVVRTSPQVGPRIWKPTLRDQVIGPDAVAYATTVERDYETVRERLHLPHGEPLGRIYGAISGVRIDAYRPQAASLRLLIDVPDAGTVVHAAVGVQVSWSGSDWLLIAPPRGDWSTVRVLVPPTGIGAFTALPGR